MLDTCELIVDVGGIYDHDKKRYDHHQRSVLSLVNSIFA